MIESKNSSETIIDLSELIKNVKYTSDYGDWTVSSWNILVNNLFWLDSREIERLIRQGYKKVTLEQLKDLIAVERL